MKLRKMAAGVAVSTIALTGGVAGTASLFAAPANAASVGVSLGSITVLGGTFTVTGISVVNGTLAVTGTFSGTLDGKAVTVTNIVLPIDLTASGNVVNGFLVTTQPGSFVANGKTYTIPPLKLTLPGTATAYIAAVNAAKTAAADLAAIGKAVGPVAKAVATAAYNAALATETAAVKLITALSPIKIIITQ